jgi:hypothetical protein
METTVETTEKIEIQKDAILHMNLRRIIIGLSEIGNLDIEDFDTNYNITKTIANLNQVDKAYNKSLGALQKKYVKKDDKGSLVIENGFFIFNSEEDKKTYGEELDKLDEVVIDETKTKVWRLKTSQLQKIKGLKGTTMSKCYELIIDDLNKK